jgi:hypothetical protein
MKKLTLLGSAILCVLCLQGCAAMFASMDEAFACSDPLSLDCTIARQKGNDARAAQMEYERELADYNACMARRADGEDVYCGYYEPVKPEISNY